MTLNLFLSNHTSSRTRVTVSSDILAHPRNNSKIIETDWYNIKQIENLPSNIIVLIGVGSKCCYKYALPTKLIDPGGQFLYR